MLEGSSSCHSHSPPSSPYSDKNQQEKPSPIWSNARYGVSTNPNANREPGLQNNVRFEDGATLPQVQAVKSNSKKLIPEERIQEMCQLGSNFHTELHQRVEDSGKTSEREERFGESRIRLMTGSTPETCHKAWEVTTVYVNESFTTAISDEELDELVQKIIEQFAKNEDDFDFDEDTESEEQKLTRATKKVYDNLKVVVSTVLGAEPTPRQKHDHKSINPSTVII